LGINEYISIFNAAQKRYDAAVGKR
jgi:hypothetical protein